jgi:hypothetical protein
MYIDLVFIQLLKFKIKYNFKNYIFKIYYFQNNKNINLISKMVILTEFRQNLFLNPEPLKSSKKYKSNPYIICNNVFFDSVKHWIVMDFINGKTFRKEFSAETLAKDTPENKFKQEDGTNIDFEMEEYLRKIREEHPGKQDLTYVEFQIPEGEKKVLAIFDGKEFTTENEDELFYNCLHTTIQKKIVKLSSEEISKIEYTLNPEFHWLWFRLDANKLSPKIVSRAVSWIKMNPEINFNLWTNIRTQEEVEDYFSLVANDPVVGPDYREFFLPRVKVHLFLDLWKMTREFFESIPINNQLASWSNMLDIINNILDRSSMIFKTDIVRCMILYLKGGWYADFNDTYCLIKLKYAINQSNPETIYMGSDYNHRHNNNYIMYCPAKNEVWLNNTLKILGFSFRIYRILDTKDDTFTSFSRAIIKTFAGLAEKTTEHCVFEEIVKRLHNWITAFNKETKEMLERIDVKIPIALDVKMNEFVLFIKYIMMKENPFSPLFKRIEMEMGMIKNVSRIGDSYRVNWESKPEEPYKPDPEDIKFWKDFLVSKNAIFNTLLQVNLKNLMYMTNMGTFFASEQASKYVYSLPYCYATENYCFISTNLHFGCGTAVGMAKKYDNNSKYL